MSDIYLHPEEFHNVEHPMHEHGMFTHYPGMPDDRMFDMNNKEYEKYMKEESDRREKIKAIGIFQNRIYMNFKHSKYPDNKIELSSDVYEVLDLMDKYPNVRDIIMNVDTEDRKIEDFLNAYCRYNMDTNPEPIVIFYIKEEFLK